MTQTKRVRLYRHYGRPFPGDMFSTYSGIELFTDPNSKSKNVRCYPHSNSSTYFVRGTVLALTPHLEWAAVLVVDEQETRFGWIRATSLTKWTDT